MSIELRDVLQVRRIPTGRRVFAQTDMARIAGELGNESLRERLEANIQHDRHTLALDLQRKEGQQKPRGHLPETGVVDRLLDRMLVAFYTTVEAKAVAYGPDNPTGRNATEVQQALFPSGVAAVSNLTYVEQHGAVAAILSRIDDSVPEDANSLAARIEGLRLDDYVAEIRTLNARYGTLLHTEKETAVSTDQLLQAREEGQSRLLSAVAVILGTYPDNTENDRQARERLMAPLMRQQEELRMLRRRRRGVVDVDPETGNESEESQAAD